MYPVICRDSAAALDYGQIRVENCTYLDRDSIACCLTVRRVHRQGRRTVVGPSSISLLLLSTGRHCACSVLRQFRATLRCMARYTACGSLNSITTQLNEHVRTQVLTSNIRIYI